MLMFLTSLVAFGADDNATPPRVAETVQEIVPAWTHIGERIPPTFSREGWLLDLSGMRIKTSNNRTLGICGNERVCHATFEADLFTQGQLLSELARWTCREVRTLESSRSFLCDTTSGDTLRFTFGVLTDEHYPIQIDLIGRPEIERDPHPDRDVVDEIPFRVRESR